MNTTAEQALSWSWSRALAGTVYALPAAAISLNDPGSGVAVAVGVLPAAMIPIPAERSARIVILIVGVLAGASLFIGGVLAHLPVPLACLLLVAAVVGAAVLSTQRQGGALVLSLCAPSVGAGMSYDDYATSATTFLLLAAGAGYAWIVSLAWPRSEGREPRPFAPATMRAMVGYGLRVGIAAALAYAIASWLDLDHPGWAPAACLLVARPQLDLLQRRGVGRVVSVAVGAIAATPILRGEPSNLALAVLTIVVLAAAAATSGSRWYITSVFTTFFVFLMLLGESDDAPIPKFNERVGETVLGVALAYLFAWTLPAIIARIAAPQSTSTGS